MFSLPIAAQLYTVRDQMAHDPLGTLRAVAAQSYDGVEFAGLHGQPPATLRALLAELGLRVCSAHVALAELEQNLDQTIADYRALGCPTLVMPWIAPAQRGDYAALGASLARIGAQVRAAGMQLAYHNHDFELAPAGGADALDTLAQADPALLFELDCGWVHKAGLDPLARMAGLAGRLPLLHVKDVDAQGDWIEAGSGLVGYERIIPAAAGYGVEWLIVELDTCPRPPLESLALSLAWLRKSRSG